MMTDKERIDFLEGLLQRQLYTGKAVLRMSANGRGWRLHETSREDGQDSVRQAIDAFIEGSK